MTPAPGFLALTNRYVLEGTLVSEAPLHIGGAAPDGDSDAPFLRDSAGHYIPGSSLRGVMRSSLERILQSLGGDRGCVLFAEGLHTRCLTDKANLKALEETLTGSDAANAEAIRRAVLNGGVCDVCALFGSPLVASKLRLDDCRLKTEERFTIRDGVGIDRDTESARDKFKFKFQALESGAEFSFFMQVENAGPKDFALLGILLGELTGPGMDVGGKKSRGFGRVKLKADYGVQYFDDIRKFLVHRLQPGGEAFRTRVQAELSEYLKEQPDAAAIG
jgi:CRISPR-associated RAMP protein (TIGR02581 family)